jgi:hypothetical protein
VSEIKQKSRNLSWGGGRIILAVRPNLPTEFELEMEALRLTEDECVASNALRAWCLRNRNRCYVPEKLLKAWGISEETEWS